MRLLLTGAAGFIGRHLLEAARSAEILAIDSSPPRHETGARVRWLVAELDDAGSWLRQAADFMPDAAVHLAWRGIPDYGSRASRDNLLAATRFFDRVLSITSCRRIVAAGSCLEYGSVQGACRESDTPGPDASFLGWAKRAACQYLALSCKAAGVSWLWLRLFYVYGPGQRGGALIPSLIAAFAAGRPPDIRQPENRNDFVHVRDAAEALWRAASGTAPAGIYNVGSGSATSVRDVARMVERAATGSTRLSDALPQAGGADFWADMTAMRNAFGWVPGSDLDAGIREMVRTNTTGGTC